MEIAPKKAKPKLLLHICCAGCGAFVSSLLLEQFELVLFYFNPNILSLDEFKKREVEVVRIAKFNKLELIIEEYNHQNWLKEVSGLEKEPEKGTRCYKCYQYRMERVATIAKKNNFDYFSTTLSLSPHKVYKYIKEIGEAVSCKYNIKFYEQDFKKNDGFKKSVLLANELNIYRQNYCGCEFSIRK